ncbi:type IV pilus biogenesis protein PilM [Pseudomonas mosselii]|uniref:Type IV pilus biogenesis protein PilM n=1 Tax=Pseudomonas mosselii TaxID=78327 RepID=A0A7W2Q104_9PSED|nr:type IV pilus biogenesis protein PilM [Pseudomonas mosselii]MBA6068121.1 type IV pilus biogenesis protein PilM [Pseudomonas mosselii]
MPLLYVMFAMLALVVGVGSSIRSMEESDYVSSDLAARASAMIVYRGAVVEYVNNNHGFYGSVPNSVLSIPAWYTPRAEIKNFVQGGVSYVYHELAPNGLVGVLANEVESVGVGTNVNGVLISPRAGDTGIILPAAIPRNATVILQ